MSECFQVLLVGPLAKHTHNALGSALDCAVRDYDDTGSMELRGQVCNGFRTESSLPYTAKWITGISGAEARVTSLLSSNLLSMPLPEMFLKLSPIFVLSKPKLVAATPDADSISTQFSTTELMKTKLHLVASEPILNTDGENHHHGYDQLAKENITTESTDVYSIAHPFGADDAAKHAWIRGFYEAPKESGLTIAVEFTAETFFIRELGEVAVGEATTGVWDMDNCLCAANESAKHTGLRVQPWDLQTTPQLNGRSGPTPSALPKMVESNNLMPNIKRRSKQNAPNAAWAAAAASMAVDMDADTGSGSGGGAIEARFKALEEENVKLRREMGEIATTVKDIGTNMNAGFQQIMQGQQQGMAALLARIQGADASVALIGHAVAGIPGTTFEMPAPTAAAVTGYGGGGGMMQPQLEQTQQ